MSWTSEEWMSASLHPIQAFDCWQEREQEHGNVAAETRHLGNLYGVKSPTPETETVREWFAREECEDNELELGIRLSLAHPQPTSQQAGPSQPRLPSPILQAGCLRSLSASLELPAALFPTLRSFSSSSPPQPFPTPALGRARAPDVTTLFPTLRSFSSSPPQPVPTPALGRARAPDVTAKEAATPPVARKRRPAASVQKSTTPLQITTQLNKDWMAASGGPIRHPTAAAAPTFHTACTVSQRPFADPHQTNRFTAVFMDLVLIDGWLQELQPPAAITIDQCPSWPDYVFDDHTLVGLGIDVTNIELYSPIHGTFIGITTKYVHTVSTDSVILLHHPGIRRPDQAQIMEAMVRATYKQQGNPMPIMVDDEPIVVDDNSDTEVQVTSGKHWIKREAGTSPAQQRPRLQVDTSIAGLSASPSSALSSAASSSALSSTLSSYSALPTSLTPVTTPPSSPKPSSRTWPQGLYISELAPGFAFMNDPKNKNIARSERFHIMFGRDFKYVQGTWNENSAYWFALSTPVQQEDAIAAGKTPKGTWSAFCTRVRESRS
ncbi:hypothetical protein C8J57DRAFT_1221486 [Mycena rebaudengoi]|nr:hypothetical protein C8J57DRAFT_1221486 [Mycena rebaudengoi]